MKKNALLLLMGVLCYSIFYSCSKIKTSDQEQIAKEVNAATDAAARRSTADSSIFDPTCLVAPHAQLKILGQGYSFTEGPAVDKKGNIFFTDQPNDKIYKWAANNGAIT